MLQCFFTPFLQLMLLNVTLIIKPVSDITIYDTLEQKIIYF